MFCYVRNKVGESTESSNLWRTQISFSIFSFISTLTLTPYSFPHPYKHPTSIPMEEHIQREAEKVKGNVLVESSTMPEGSETVEGYNFNNGIDFEQVFNSYRNIGFQATNLGLAIQEVNRMVW